MADDSMIKPFLSDSVQHALPQQTAARRYRRSKTAPSRNTPLEQKSSLSPPFFKPSFVELRPSFRLVGMVLMLYLGIGMICFFLVKDQIRGEKRNGLIDALYFCIVTMTTVGYGDLVPSSTLAKLLACIFVFSGMVVVGFILSKAADYLVEKQEILVVKALYGSGNIDTLGKLKEVETNRAKFKFIVTAVILFMLMVIGTVFLYEVEKLSFIDAFYCVCSTITTLGYGDKSFSTVGGRVFAILWILASTICLAQLFLYLAEMSTEQKQHMLANMVLKRRMTFLDLEAADLDYDGQVGAAEFVIYKLKELGKITQDDINRVMEHFEVLDVDQSGTLTHEDLLFVESTCR